MNTSSLSSHLHDCKVQAGSVSCAKRKWRDFDPLNRVPYHLKMLIQISFCYDLQYEKFLSFLSYLLWCCSTKAIIRLCENELQWFYPALVWFKVHIPPATLYECLVGLCSPGLCTDHRHICHLELSYGAPSSDCSSSPWFTSVVSVVTNMWKAALLAVLTAPGFLREVF